MLALIPVLLLLPTALGSAVPPPLVLERATLEVSPNKTCGTTGAGSAPGFTCADPDGCCSKFGYCGSGDGFCLTSAGCQTKFSNKTTSCYAPKSGSTVSVDGTCGVTEAGTAGYVCPSNGTATCCSSSGYCGNTTGHCAAAEGCQSKYGKCTGTAAARLRSLFSVNLFA